MERHFHCTACGKCCYGWLPLTLSDAVAHAGRFPLAMVWTTVRQGAKAFEHTARLGISLKVGKRKRVAVQIAPTAYIPPSFSCPELAPDGGCAIHAAKPVRCRAMPFSAYQPEADQANLLIPKPGWQCDTSDGAPVVYRGKKVVPRGDFDEERRELARQAPVLSTYADRVIATAPNVAAALESAANKPKGGYVVLKFSAIVPRIDGIDLAAFSRLQLPVLNDFAERTADDPALADYHRYYRECALGMERVLEKG